MEFHCPGCQTKLQVPDSSQGKKARCPTCGVVAQIPAAPAPAVPEQEAPLLAEPADPLPENSAGALDEAFQDSPRSPRKNQEGRDRSDRRRADEDDDWDDDDYRPRRRARRRPREDDALATIIPYKNGMALAAYYCGIFGLIPCAGLILGTLALIFGIVGLRRVRERPEMHGTGHAITGIVLGILEIIGNLACVVIGLIGALAKK
jgi:hypothetical protein